MWTFQNDQQMKAILELEGARSARVVAIVGGAVLEQCLQNSLQWRLLPDKVGIERMFKPTGPLGPFANKIDLGYLLYMYDKPTRDVMSGVCKIRNFFAHQLVASFDAKDKNYQKAFARLTLHKTNEFYPDMNSLGPSKDKIPTPRSKRAVFVENIKILMFLLIRDMNMHMPWSNQPGVTYDAMRTVLDASQHTTLLDTRARPKPPRRQT